ncbi:MAG: amino acid permease [Holosporales bacterium]|jgi:APA family basic amino acid/polyamine antiporter|nr:amino acid permease [Holosporales bacterium]
MANQKELSFLALISIVISSQVGSGTFIFPSVLAPFGVVGLFGWIVSVCGAISLAIIFSELSAKYSKNGGPHVYVTEAFGKTAGFFTAWTYWIISWSSNSLLLVTTTLYLTVITGALSPTSIVIIETATLFIITFVNIIGVRFSGIMETIFTVLKVIPLFILPIIFFNFFDISNFRNATVVTTGSNLGIIAKTALLTSWGFIGVECATTPAGCVKNAKKTIPRAIILGTSCVAIIYLLNVISVIGVTGFDSLIETKAPYSFAIEKVFGENGYGNILIALLAIIVCIGTLNAWTLTGGQIAEGAAADGLFPKSFGKTYKNGTPIVSLTIAAIGIIPFFIVEQIYGGNNGLDYLIDLLVSIFLFVYIICCVSYIKMVKNWKKSLKDVIKSYVLAIFAILFCLFVALGSMISSLIVLGIFIIAGLPVYIYVRKNLFTHNSMPNK